MRSEGDNDWDSGALITVYLNAAVKKDQTPQGQKSGQEAAHLHLLRVLPPRRPAALSGGAFPQRRPPEATSDCSHQEEQIAETAADHQKTHQEQVEIAAVALRDLRGGALQEQSQQRDRLQQRGHPSGGFPGRVQRTGGHQGQLGVPGRQQPPTAHQH